MKTWLFCLCHLSWFTCKHCKLIILMRFVFSSYSRSKSGSGLFLFLLLNGIQSCFKNSLFFFWMNQNKMMSEMNQNSSYVSSESIDRERERRKKNILNFDRLSNTYAWMFVVHCKKLWNCDFHNAYQVYRVINDNGI